MLHIFIMFSFIAERWMSGSMQIQDTKTLVAPFTNMV